MTHATSPDAFIARWKDSDASELSTAQSFLNDLIGLIGADRPDPSHAHGYSFEYPVTFARTGTPGRIDLYKRGCFVLEAKRGALPPPPTQLPLLPGVPPRRPVRPIWDDAMVRARGQAEAYARALPDEYPPTSPAASAAPAPIPSGRCSKPSPPSATPAPPKAAATPPDASR